MGKISKRFYLQRILKVILGLTNMPSPTLLLLGGAVVCLSSSGGGASPVWPEPLEWSVGTTELAVSAPPHFRIHFNATHTQNTAVPTHIQAAFDRFYKAAFPHRVLGSPLGPPPSPFLPISAKTPSSLYVDNYNYVGGLEVTVTNANADLQLYASEAYNLTIANVFDGGNHNAKLSADTQFGLYRGLETLSQLVAFDFETLVSHDYLYSVWSRNRQVQHQGLLLAQLFILTVHTRSRPSSLLCLC